MTVADLKPNESVGGIRFQDDISKYVHLEHVLYPRGDDFDNDLYVFSSPAVSAYVSDNQKVLSINCSKECFWKNVNLIGLDIEKFSTLSDLKPDYYEKIYILIKGRGQNQTVYDFDCLGIQIWTWRRKIVSVFCSNYLQDD